MMIVFVGTMATITEPLGNLGRTVQVQDYSPGAALSFSDGGSLPFMKNA